MAVLSHCLAQAKRLSLLAVLSVFCLGLTLPAKAICRDATAFGNGFEKQLKEEQPASGQEACTGVWLDMDGEGRIGLFAGNNPVNNIDPYGLWIWFGWFRSQPRQPAPYDPNSYKAMRDSMIGDPSDYDFNGQSAGQVTKDIGMAVPKGIINTAAAMLGPGEAESAYAAADEALQAARAANAAKAAARCLKVTAKASEKAKLLAGKPDFDNFIGIIDQNGNMSLFKAGENDIYGHADLVRQGLATEGETLGFSVGLNANGNPVVQGISELNVHIDSRGQLPTSLVNSIEQAFGGP